MALQPLFISGWEQLSAYELPIRNERRRTRISQITRIPRNKKLIR